jgi:DNA-binding NarL/FixJ family response regulator
MSKTSSELSRLSDLIGLIYEGATDPSRWTKDILPGVVEYIQAPKCAMFTPLHSPSMGGFHFIHGISQDIDELRQTSFSNEDVWTKAGLEKGVLWEGNIVMGTELISHEQLVKTRWYREYLTRDPGLMQLMTSIIFGLETSTSMPTACSLFRSMNEPTFGESDRERMRLILPHLSRALGVMQRIRFAELTVASTLSALDRLSTGVLLINAAGEVTFINNAAREMLEKGDGLMLRRLTRASGLGNLSSDNELVNRAIAAALRSTLNRDPYGTEHFSDSVLVPRTSGSMAYALQFSALGSQNEFNSDSSASAIVFLTDGAQQVEVNPDLLLSAYGLTQAEARVAIALLECSSAQEVADYFGVTFNTVRTQIKEVYGKLGVDSRARFTKLMLGLANHRH